MLSRKILATEVLVGLMLCAGTVQAQEIRAATAPITVLPNAAADRLHARAELLYGVPGRLRDAAVLHEREASARAASDRKGIDALDRAARLYAYAGNRARARGLMQKAGDRALRAGELVRAAHAYIDAAFLALDAHDVTRAYALTKKADLLASSPHLDSADRAGIVRRIDPARATLGLLDHP
jgi:hypothetical protein